MLFKSKNGFAVELRQRAAVKEAMPTIKNLARRLMAETAAWYVLLA